jgi:hypothetical protein
MIKEIRANVDDVWPRKKINELHYKLLKEKISDYEIG